MIKRDEDHKVFGLTVLLLVLITGLLKIAIAHNPESFLYGDVVLIFFSVLGFYIRKRTSYRILGLSMIWAFTAAAILSTLIILFMLIYLQPSI